MVRIGLVDGWYVGEGSGARKEYRRWRSRGDETRRNGVGDSEGDMREKGM